MFKHYLTTAWRSFIKNPLFSGINILGLAMGMATCFAIMMYVQDELRFDRFHQKSAQIARIVFQSNVNGGKINEAFVMAPVAQTLKKDFPEVLDATRIVNMGSAKIVYDSKLFKDDRFAFVDPNFFSVFSFPLLKGDPQAVLAKPRTVVITTSTAIKYFGSEEPIGKTILITANNQEPFEVTGVIADMPRNSHFHFDVLASTSGWEPARSDSWMGGNFYTYLLLRPDARLSALEARLPAMVKTYMGPQIQREMGISLQQFQSKGNHLGFALQPLSTIHLHSHTNNEFEPGGNAAYVYIFSGVALFMLVVACINFINLSTAAATKRAKEVGVRKVAGSGKGHLVLQFLSESILITAFALVVAGLLLWLTLPLFNTLSGKDLVINRPPVLLFIVIGLLVGILAGIYPAFYLSSFSPMKVLKGKGVSNRSSFGLRSSLVVLQFFIAVTLIIGTLVVYQQMRFIQQKDLGYNKDQLITIPNSYVLGSNEAVFRQEMLRDPRVVSATTSWYKPAGPTSYNNSIISPQGNDNLIVNGVDYHVDEQYIPTLGMSMLAGRNFSPEFHTDSNAIILNETAVQALGWTTGNAVGRQVKMLNYDRSTEHMLAVIGVVKNFNFRSLHETVSPLYMTLRPEGGLVFKVKATDAAGLLATMKNKWNGFTAEEPFTYHFMDELFTKTYAAEQKTSTMLNLFSALTIFVACMGLFGLVTYTAEQRTKEIGIRKVLGASVGQITGMLSRDFVRLVLLAAVLAFPLAGWLMTLWLRDFAYKVSLNWWTFAIALSSVMLIALLTVSFQAIKAALANPVKSLHTE